MQKVLNVALVALAGYAAVMVGYLFLAPPLALIFVLSGSTVMLLAFVLAIRHVRTHLAQ